MLLAETVGSGAERGHDPHLLGDLGAGDHGVRRVVRAEHVLGQRGPHLVLHVAPTAVECVAQMFGGARHFWRHNPTVTRRRGLRNKSATGGAMLIAGGQAAGRGGAAFRPTCIHCEFKARFSR